MYAHPSPYIPELHRSRRWRWHSRAVLRDIARFRRAALLAAEATGGADGGGEKGAAAVERVAKCYGFMWTFRLGQGLFRNLFSLTRVNTAVLSFESAFLFVAGFVFVS